MLKKYKTQNDAIEGSVPIVTRYAEKHGIEDEDFIQEMYINMICYVGSRWNKYDKAGLDQRVWSVTNQFVKRHKTRRPRKIEIETEPIDEIVVIYHIAERVDMKERLNKAMRGLTDRERTVIEYRYGFGGGDEMTYKEIGNILGVTCERVRQIEAKALRKLRHPAIAKSLKDFLED